MILYYIILCYICSETSSKPDARKQTPTPSLETRFDPLFWARSLQRGKRQAIIAACETGVVENNSLVIITRTTMI